SIQYLAKASISASCAAARAPSLHSATTLLKVDKTFSQDILSEFPIDNLERMASANKDSNSRQYVPKLEHKAS
ncbi:hypothetical protein ALC53_10667, partial [Atta colombica]